MSEKDIFKLAKILHDARMADCWITKDQIKREQDKFPEDLTPRNYTVPQTAVDIALAQARAVYKHYNLTAVLSHKQGEKPEGLTLEKLKKAKELLNRDEVTFNDISLSELPSNAVLSHKRGEA